MWGGGGTPVGRSTAAFDGEDYFHPSYEASKAPNTYRCVSWLRHVNSVRCLIGDQTV